MLPAEMQASEQHERALMQISNHKLQWKAECFIPAGNPYPGRKAPSVFKSAWFQFSSCMLPLSVNSPHPYSTCLIGWSAHCPPIMTFQAGVLQLNSRWRSLRTSNKTQSYLVLLRVCCCFFKQHFSSFQLATCCTRARPKVLFVSRRSPLHNDARAQLPVAFLCISGAFELKEWKRCYVCGDDSRSGKHLWRTGRELLWMRGLVTDAVWWWRL